MTRLRTSRFFAAGAAGLLGAAALVAGTTTMASADDVTSPAIPYTCQDPLGNSFTLTVTYQLDSQIASGPGVTNNVTMTAAMDPAELAVIGGFLPRDVTLYTNEPFTGDRTKTKGFGFGSLFVPGTWKFTQPNSADPTTAVGTLGEIPTSANGDYTVLAPDGLDFFITSLNVDTWCVIGSPTNVGDVTVGFAAEGTPIPGTAKAGKNAITYSGAGIADGNGGTTPGTGAVKATGKVKVAKKVKKGKKKVTKYVAKSVTSNGTLDASGNATLKLKLPKGTKKGAYKFTVTWNGTSTTVTVKVKK
jgi:hypothetical protein